MYSNHLFMIIVIFPVAISYTGTFDWNMVEDFLHDYEKSKYSSLSSE